MYNWQNGFPVLCRTPNSNFFQAFQLFLWERVLVFPYPVNEEVTALHPFFEMMGSSPPMTSKSLLIDFLPTQYLSISPDTVSFFPARSIRSISLRRRNAWSDIFSPLSPLFLTLIIYKVMLPLWGHCLNKFQSFFLLIRKVKTYPVKSNKHCLCGNTGWFFHSFFARISPITAQKIV